MQKQISVIFCLVAICASLHTNLNHFAVLAPGKITLAADSGKFLARCNGCGPAAYPDSAAIHETNPNNPWAIWTV